MNNNEEWPIAPTFLSLRQGCTEDSANYNTDGIYYTDYLRGFLADLSHDKNIQNALSLFQFVPKDFLPHDPNAENPNEITKDPTKATVIWNDPLDPKIAEILDRQGKIIIRIDSGTYVNNGRLCDAFRKCKGDHTSFCFKQDSTVGIFADKALNELQRDTNEYHQRLVELVTELSKDREERRKIECEDIEVSIKVSEKETKTEKRLYIYYTCPYSLFEEHIFPIYVQGRVIACLMYGQVGRESFDNARYFSNDLKEMTKIYPDCPKILSDIKYVDNNQWKEKARAIVERIVIFEKRLEERILHRNTRYVNEAFEEIETKFREEVKNINIREEDVFSQFTKVLNKAFDNIRRKFDSSDDGFIRMFALPISIEHEELVPIGWSGSDFETWKNVKIAIKKLKGIETTLEIEDKNERIKEQRRIILEAASKDISDNFNGDLDFFLPGWLAGNEVAYIVWKRHSRELRNENNKINFKTYRTALKNFYSIAQERYSYIRGAKMELLLETAIKVSTHESAHFILPAINVIENKIEMLPQEMVISSYAEYYSKTADTFGRYKAEVLELLDQLMVINSGSSLVFLSELKIKKEKVEVFYLLYKLKLLLSNLANKDGHKSIFYEQSSHYVEAAVDATVFNHALYNLLDNAIKYGHEGSKIYINMNVDKQKDKLNVLITSYGIGIPQEEEKRIYKLFARGTEASNISRGNGLGMYIVQNICKAHGGEVTHTSKKISDYNIPILFNFKYKSSLAKKHSETEIECFKKEIHRLSLEGREQEVVSDIHFVEYAHVFSSRIYMPTYRNTFIVIIPLH